MGCSRRSKGTVHPGPLVEVRTNRPNPEELFSNTLGPIGIIVVVYIFVILERTVVVSVVLRGV